ncbi:ABC transporter permease [Methylosinus sp. H3A]|uniref:ABC transporter permease n=1 Tax=Methylosinus sp. H3A TaxID=2785786 RepID=UPI0018C261EF|nr:ABC transporter permease [Methylosinus sp. H3A]MBG0808287.1 ABC transporter permease [Methylosinus sp. H3A]
MALAVLFILFLVVAAGFPEWLATGDPFATNPRHAFSPPGAEHLFGTDENGRDVATRIVYGARSSLFLGLSAAILTVSLGIVLGLLAGLSHRVIDNAVMRFVDILQSFPEILLVLLIVSFWGNSVLNLLLALGVAGVPRGARQVRAQVLVIRNAPFVEAARTLGIPSWLVSLRHVLPNSIGPVLVILPIEVGWKISAAAALSYLGLGAPPPAPDWGAMLAVGREYIMTAWWLTATPAVTITLTVLSVTILGRSLIRRSEGRGA